ncbi:uncharacterized protein LOC143150958 isoform X1 [Ptiloglossa arizonensis]|uniref:uncharacterized protein LOC143150958 isoform X1 n=1 Tax=Ptiloglossa arizonensis TaxID=3350558 RepID=UPI003F9F024B
MSRACERDSGRWNAMDARRANESNTTEDSSTTSDENSVRVRNTSTPLRGKWTDPEENRRAREPENEDTEYESSDVKRSEERRRGREVLRDRLARRRKGKRDRRRKRGGTEDNETEKPDETSSQSSRKRYDDGDAVPSKRTNRDFRAGNELPITEILKRSEENARTEHEHQPPQPEFNPEKIYVQYRDGFSAVKIHRSRIPRDGRKTGDDKVAVEKRDSPPIRVAIGVQRISRSIGLAFQGLLAGMALMHFVTLQVFFEASMEFVASHSAIGEIYANVFSFFVAVCIVSTLDKFDLARFDAYRLREIYLERNTAVFAVPLYSIVFCLHLIGSWTDNRLASVHRYAANDSLWENVTATWSLMDDLSNWQRISMSKDALAVCAWLFVSLGTKDDAFLTHLRSMEKYTNDVVESPRR